MKRFLFAIAAAAIASTGCVFAAKAPARIVVAQEPPGGEVLVLDHGRVVYDRVFGVKNIKAAAAVDQHTRFEIGSVTKQFTAAAILQLAEAGKLSLSDPLGRYVPEYTRAERVTLRQLLRQVSGIPNYTEADAYFGSIVKRDGVAMLRYPDNLAAILSLIKDRPLDFRSGTRWAYSNSNYYLLGAVIAAVSHMSWQDYVQTHIFDPLKMRESSFVDREASVPDMATGYDAAKSGGYIQAGEVGLGADGGIVSTAHDIARWDEALFAGAVISTKDLAAMISPGPLRAWPDEPGYGFGWSVGQLYGVTKLSHDGSTLGFASTNQVYPSLRQDVIVLTNFSYAPAFRLADKAFSAHNPVLTDAANVTVRGEDKRITGIVRRLWGGILSDNLDRSILSAGMSAFMTDASVAEKRDEFKKIGPVRTWVYRGKDAVAKGTLYHYRVIAAGGTEDIAMIINKGGRIDGLLFETQ